MSQSIRMPHSVFSIYNIFLQIQNMLLKDFQQIHHVNNRERFIKNSQHFINKNLHIDNMILENFGLYVDGYDNLMCGIPLCSLVGYINDSILIFDIFSNTYYWTFRGSLYVNQFKLPYVQTQTTIINTDIIPLSLAIGWLITGAIEEINLTKNQLVFLETDMTTDALINILKYTNCQLIDGKITRINEPLP
jgi:hypothetical protein